MKYLWLDLLIAFCIWQLGTYIYTHTTDEYYFSKEIEQFNEDIKNENIITSYHLPKENNPNNVSDFVEKMSDISRFSIETSVDVLISFLEGFR